MPRPERPHRLVTEAASPYAELARWALDLAGVAYREERHLPTFQAPAALIRRGGVGPVTLFLADGRILYETVDVVRLADDRTGGMLLARGQPDRAEVLEWEAIFTSVLGPATKRLLYAHLLTNRTLAVRAFGALVPAAERWAWEALHPGLMLWLERTLPLDAASRAEAEAEVRAVFDRVDETLAARMPMDVGTDLPARLTRTGDAPTAADLALAALASPVLWPPEAEEATRLPIDDLPPAHRDLVGSLRETRTGRFVLELYRRERRHAGAAGP